MSTRMGGANLNVDIESPISTVSNSNEAKVMRVSGSTSQHDIGMTVICRVTSARVEQARRAQLRWRWRTWSAAAASPLLACTNVPRPSLTALPRAAIVVQYSEPLMLTEDGVVVRAIERQKCLRSQVAVEFSCKRGLRMWKRCRCQRSRRVLLVLLLLLALPPG